MNMKTDINLFSWMSISKDIGQVLALMMFKPIISGTGPSITV